MAVRKERDNYSIDSLIADDLTKEDLMAYILNCEGMFDDEVDSVVVVLSNLLAETTDERDKAWFVLLSCTGIYRQIVLGTGMLEEHVGDEEALPYWMAIHDLAVAPTGDRILLRVEH